jgi:hypothetical protein
MIGQHPITPPPELVQQWIKEFSQPNNPRWQEYEQDIAARAAQWGADQELEACCEWMKLEGHEYEHKALFAARRPKPPSLKDRLTVALQNEDIGTALRLVEQLDD